MVERSFDRLVRTLSANTPRRRLLTTTLATVLAVSTHNQVSARRKKRSYKKSQKKCGKACIARTQCCTSADFASEALCSTGRCECFPQCTGKVCGDDGCGGSYGSSGQCEACTPQCVGTTCGTDECGGSCGSCENGTCSNGPCICPFAGPCTPGQCCANEQTCQGDACARCPETPDACAVEIVCGRTSATSPLCYCLTSVDDVTTCSSVFVHPSQSTNCTSDADCVGLLGLGVDMVCVNVPCLGLGFSKVCMNQGCEDLSPGRDRSTPEHDTPEVQQAVWPKRR